MDTVVSITYDVDMTLEKPSWYTQKNPYEEEEDVIVMPTIYTYWDRSSDSYVNEEILQVWKQHWEATGWNARFLSLEQAKQHVLYDKFNQLLDAAKICCLPKQTFMRFLAMATIQEGGFYSEPYVFPLMKEFSKMTIPLKGTLTSYEDTYFSLVSGSYKEWNRITNLLMKNIEKNADLTLILLQQSDPFVVQLENNIELPQSNQTFTCESKGKFAVRFSHDTSKESIVSWLNLYGARCVSGRPVMFTFFEDSPHKRTSSKSDQRLARLNDWKMAWSDQGWEPYVLTLEDAKRHHNYTKYINVLDSLGLKNPMNGRDEYIFLSIMRWLAMASSGGGWMSNIDTFPLHLEPCYTLPNNGKFTGHNWVIPNLLSGNYWEWNRITDLLINHLFLNYQNGFWSDIQAFSHIFHIQSAFLAQKYVREVAGFYKKELNQHHKQINDYTNFNKDICAMSQNIMAVHFSFSSFHD